MLKHLLPIYYILSTELFQGKHTNQKLVQFIKEITLSSSYIECSRKLPPSLLYLLFFNLLKQQARQRLVGFLLIETRAAVNLLSKTRQNVARQNSMYVFKTLKCRSMAGDGCNIWIETCRQDLADTFNNYCVQLKDTMVGESDSSKAGVCVPTRNTARGPAFSFKAILG